jgi:outer membrane protein assembly factor BamB
MTDAPKTDRPIRIWPAMLLALAYWAHQVYVAQSDMAMFPRFMSKSLGGLVFLLVFLILWLSNGTVRGRLRLAGLGLFLAGLAVAFAAAHRTFEPIGFMMTAVPIVLTIWTGWLVLHRFQGLNFSQATLAAAVLLPFAYADLLRFDGLDGRLKPTLPWRWESTDEQRFLSARGASEKAEAAARPWTVRAGDWPEFRGPRRDGVVRGIRIATDWNAAPPEKIWKQRVGPAWSSMIVVDGYLVTQEQRGETEAIVCYDAETGKESWSHQNAARFTEGVSGAGPRATPTFHGGRIYALGAAGALTCLEAASGKPVWSVELAKQAPMWGLSASPIVVDGKVVVFVGGPNARGAVAVDAATGKEVWARDGGKESYSSAHLVSIRGKPQIMMHDNKRLAALSVADGTVLWERPGENENIIPMIQPHPMEAGLLLVSSGQDLTLLDVCEDAGKWTASEKWSTKKFKPSFNDFVVHEGHAYGLDDGILSCVDLKSGERVWKKGRYGSGQVMLLADQGALLILSEKGELAVVDARPQEPGDPVRIPAIEGKTWNHPALVKDRLFVRNATEMACYRLRSP